MRWPGRKRVRTLYFAPDYTAFNPFQSMLNGALASDITAVPVPAKELVARLREADPGSVFHLHWTAPILQWAKDRAAAEQALADFVDALAGFQSRGGKLIWSIHNALHQPGVVLVGEGVDREAPLHDVCVGLCAELNIKMV